MEFHRLPKPSRSSLGSLGAMFASPEHVVVVRPAMINGSRPLDHPAKTSSESPKNRR